MRRVIILLFTLLFLFSLVTPVSANATIRVYYAGPQDNSVYTALTLAPHGTFSFVSDPSQADVFLLNGIIPDPSAIATQVQRGAGLVLIMGPGMSAKDVETISSVPVSLTEKSDAVSLTEIKISDPLVTQIIWNGAPQVRDRMEVLTPFSSVQPLVTAYETGAWILWAGNHQNIYFFNAFLTNYTDPQSQKTSAYNPQIQEWAYFNYLIYHLVVRAAGQTPLSFADYPASPVPHIADRNLLLTLMGLMMITTFGAFFLVRRYSLKHPEELDKIVSDRTKFRGPGSKDGVGRGGLSSPSGRVPGSFEYWPRILYPAHYLPEPDPAYLHPSVGASPGHLGTRDSIFQPCLDLLRHGDEYRLY